MYQAGSKLHCMCQLRCECSSNWNNTNARNACRAKLAPSAALQQRVVCCVDLWVSGGGGHFWLGNNLTLPCWAKFACITLVFSFLKPDSTCQHLGGGWLERQMTCAWKTAKHIDVYRPRSSSGAHTDLYTCRRTYIPQGHRHTHQESGCFCSYAWFFLLNVSWGFDGI